MAKFTEDEARAAIAAALCWADALRALGLRSAGGNHRTLQRWAATWEIDTSHFDANAVRRRALRPTPVPLEEMLVERSPFGRQTVKRRLLEAGLKHPVCELCGQEEIWQGRRMSIILDHINGVADDHRLENLQMVCPNCAATLTTHCGRQNRLTPFELRCPTCRVSFEPRNPRQRYCSQTCAYQRLRGVPQMERRVVRRPPYAQLEREIHALGWEAVGRRYGVSGNAVRKWVAQYEREREREAEGDAGA
ncbi:MAG: endonuclease [Conexibacter sp.]|jgi:hypothetical protein|nr:endonuclease [Conexibacter sp.]MDX6730856.1 hypothetical protein [Baekduia sp.]